ncbi:hypothetical protein [Flavobacterium sp. '19STA2R22 D10 B1']|uniref:hypothetical protein n=1 Tax=Flavobacterium aerium TaxID=3037261 RepID=UPI00278BF325|nr:hypothetical protein [Flavobacterium sp. '19STA2R22 D10 B1']
MFQKIQRYLLINHPLLWNTKIVPTVAILILFHICFFAIGYVGENINFSEYNYYYSSNFIDNGIIVFISILISVLTFIVWMVLYCRNNAFKSFYPKKSNALFKEWCIILIICLLNCTYTVSYFYGINLKIKSYYSEEVVMERANIISMASLFVTDQYYNMNEIRSKNDTVKYQGKIYSINSLINQRMYNSLDSYTHSNNEIRVKNWLVNNQKDSVVWVMKEFIKIADVHQLKANITAEKWSDLVYHAPEFTEYETISRIKKELYSNNNIENKYYVPFNSLERTYSKLSQAWSDPFMDLFALNFILYVTIISSFLVFSFKTTSGRSWLIAFVALNVVGIITGIFAAIFNSIITYSIIWIIIIILLFLYYVSVCIQKNGKRKSDIILNIVLWLLPILPLIVYGLLLEFTKDYYYAQRKLEVIQSGITSIEVPYNYSTHNWLQDNFQLFLYINSVFIILYMFFFSKMIQKWKGIPEA